jgi:hypothetical protein
MKRKEALKWITTGVAASTIGGTSWQRDQDQLNQKI